MAVDLANVQEKLDSLAEQVSEHANPQKLAITVERITQHFRERDHPEL